MVLERARLAGMDKELSGRFDRMNMELHYCREEGASLFIALLLRLPVSHGNRG